MTVRINEAWERVYVYGSFIYAFPLSKVLVLRIAAEKQFELALIKQPTFLIFVKILLYGYVEG